MLLVETTAPMPRVVAALERVTAFDRKMLQHTDTRLTELYQPQVLELFIVCAHYPTLIEHARASA